MSQRTPTPRTFGLSVRDLIILVISLGGGVGTEQLLVYSGTPLGQAVIAGFGGFGAVFYFLDRITEPESQ
jgi:hypothetical protein